VRFPLSQDVQNELTAYLTNQKQEFRIGIQNEILFDGKYKPDEGEVLYIENFDEIDGLAQAIRTPLGYPEVVPSEEEFAGIKALFSGDIDDDGIITVLIQQFDKRKIISTNGLSIFHSTNVYRKVEDIGVTVDSKLTATLREGKLTFFSFHMLRQVFDLSEYYREATDTDITDFAALDVISVADVNQLIAISDTWIRRKFSLIQQSQILDTVPMTEIRAVATEFNIPLDTTILEDGTEKIILPSKKADLKTILRFLDEDYYKSPLSKTRFITNSKRVA
jgi:hypothetical protein